MGAAMNMLRYLIVALALLLGGTCADAASRFAVCTVTCTWDGSSTAMWSATTGGATGASVPGSADTVTLDAATCVGGVTCTITVNTNPTIVSLTMGACSAATAGCVLDFSANNNSITLTSATTPFSASGTGTRTLNMGNGTWTLSGSPTVSSTLWNILTTTNLTFSAGTSTIAFTGTGAFPSSFTGGGLTYATIAVSANVNRGGFVINGANTFGTLTVAAPNYVSLQQTTTLTITNAFTFTGTAGNSINLSSATSTGISTLSTAAASTLTWGAVRGITLTGGGSLTATNAFDAGGNTNVTITPPSASGSSGHIIGG